MLEMWIVLLSKLPPRFELLRLQVAFSRFLRPGVTVLVQESCNLWDSWFMEKVHVKLAGWEKRRFESSF